MATGEQLSEEQAYLNCEDATELWAIVRNRTYFNRRPNDLPSPQDPYNQRLLYLLAVAVFGRLGHLVKHRAWRNLMTVTEAYAEGSATIDQLEKAAEKAEYIDTRKSSAARTAAVDSISHIMDDYKVIRGVGLASDAAGYLAAVKAGELPARATFDAGRSVWKSPGFLAGKKAEELAICAVIREIFGNPFGPPPTIDPYWLTHSGGNVPALAATIYDEKAFDRLPILGDALQDAGCDSELILNHCRGSGPHVRGCWMLDLILEKS